MSPASCARRQLERWLDEMMSGNARTINRGACMDFAAELADTLIEKGMSPELWAVDDPGGYMMHVWVYVNETDLHYDSEAPEGVKEWDKLPIFQPPDAPATSEPRLARQDDLVGVGVERCKRVLGW